MHEVLMPVTLWQFVKVFVGIEPSSNYKKQSIDLASTEGEFSGQTESIMPYTENKEYGQLHVLKKNTTSDVIYTIFPTPGDPTNIILSTEDTRAWPVSAKLKTKKRRPGKMVCSQQVN